MNTVVKASYNECDDFVNRFEGRPPYWDIDRPYLFCPLCREFLLPFLGPSSSCTFHDPQLKHDLLPFRATEAWRAAQLGAQP